MTQRETLSALKALLDRTDDRVATMANAAAFLSDAVPGLDRVGFYLLSGGALVLGPFIGKPAEPRIPEDDGLLWATLKAKRLFSIPDTAELGESGTGDALSVAELAVPLWAPCGEARGVLRIGSPEKDRFTAEDEDLFTAAGALVMEKLYAEPKGERMDPRTFLDYLSVCERLKSEPRHCFTAGGIREYVAGHSWRIALMAMLLAPEFPELDMDRVVRMCLIHDLGEAVTGDIPTFCKTAADEAFEQRKLAEFTDMLPGDQNRMLKTLFAEMDALKTPEARFYKCLDKLEAVIQHNESDTATWTAIEYELNRHYAVKEAAAFPWLKALRDEMLKDTEQKIAEAEAANLSPANDALFG